MLAAAARIRTEPRERVTLPNAPRRLALTGA